MFQGGPRPGDLHFALVVAEDAVVSDFGEARREHVQEQAADKLVVRESHGLDLIAVSVVLVSEGEGTSGGINGKQAAIADGDPMGVTAQILENRFGAGDGAFGEDNPAS